MRSQLFNPILVLSGLALLSAVASLGQTRPPVTAGSGPGPIFKKGQLAPTANFTG